MKNLSLIVLLSIIIILSILYYNERQEYKTVVETKTNTITKIDTVVVKDTIQVETEIIQPPDTVYVNNNQYMLYTTSFSKKGVSGNVYSTVDGELIKQSVTVRQDLSFPVSHTTTTIRETITTYPTYYSMGLQISGNTESLNFTPTVSYTFSSQNRLTLGYNITQQLPVIGFSYRL